MFVKLGFRPIQYACWVLEYGDYTIPIYVHSVVVIESLGLAAFQGSEPRVVTFSLNELWDKGSTIRQTHVSTTNDGDPCRIIVVEYHSCFSISNISCAKAMGLVIGLHISSFLIIHGWVRNTVPYLCRGMRVCWSLFFSYLKSYNSLHSRSSRLLYTNR